MFISQLIIAPVVILEVWFYYMYVKRRDGIGLCAFDYMVIAAAVLACAAMLPMIAGHDSGANDKIWHPVLSVLTTFHVFPLVLLIGLWFRRRFVSL